MIFAPFLFFACEQPRLMHPVAISPLASVSSTTVEISSPGYRILQEPISIAQAEGAGEATIQADDFLAEGDRLGAFVEPPIGACLLAVARGSESIDDLDLLAFDEEGSPLAVDEAQDATPALLLCPPHPKRVYLMVRGMVGRGRAALSTQQVPLGSALRVGKVLHTRGQPNVTGREAEVWPGLDGKVAAMRRLAGGQWREVRRVALPAEARAPGYLTEALEAGRCLLWMATPSEETTEMDGQILDHEGRIVGRVSELGRERLGIVCSSSPTTVGLELRPRIGGGMIAVVIARSIPGTEADIRFHTERLDPAPDGSPEDTLRPILQQLNAAGYRSALARIQGQVKVGQLTTFPLQLKAGCVRIDLVGGAPLAGMDASLWTEQGTLLARAEGGASAALFACGTGGTARLEVEARQRPGPFLAELREDSPSSLPLELASGRLLARSNASGSLVRPAMLQRLLSQPLTTTQVARVTHSISSNQCAELGGALGEGGNGIELRIFDASSREELGRGTGGAATVTTVCAPDRSLDLQIEARLLAGNAPVLLTVRPMVAPQHR